MCVLAIGFLIFFVAAILPRLVLILAGASQADDWAPSAFAAHLTSYRPVAALELWVMQSLFGPDYLITKLPKILSAIWYALSFTALLRLTLQFGVPAMLFILLGATALMHPIFNELILWGVLSTLGFVTFLGVVGVTLVYVGKSSVARVVGLILLSLGAAGSQIGAAIGAGVVLAELSYRGLRATIAAGRAELLWRLMVVITPPTIAIGVLLLMRFGMGYEDFASRSIGFSSPTVLAWFKDKFYVFSNAFANLYQAPVGIALGNSIALSALWPAVVLPTLTLYCLFIFNGLAKSTSLVYAVTPLAIFGVVLAPLLGATAMPTGYRILGGPVLLLVFGLSIVLGQFWPFAIMKRLIAALLAVCAVLLLWASLTDIAVREIALRRDNSWLAETRLILREAGGTELRLCSWSFERPTKKSVPESGILVSYSPATVDGYSVWYNHFLFDFLKVNGIRSVAPDTGRSTFSCIEHCRNERRRTIGSFQTHFDEKSSSLYICSE